MLMTVQVRNWELMIEHQPDLGFDLVTLGDGHLAHIVADAGDLGTLGIVPGASGSRPGCQLGLDCLILPETDDHFTVQPHPGSDETEFTAPVGRLIQVHEIHIDPGPRDVAIELRVQVDKGFLQCFQARDPHLGWAEGMHRFFQDRVLSSF